MKIEPNSVVSIHYTLTNETGEVIDSSADGETLNYLAGAGNIIPGLDSELMGCAVGDKKQVIVQPEDGYGKKDPSLVQTLPSSAFTGIEKIEVGMEFQAENEAGEAHYVVVIDVADNEVTIDGNHALAGQVLNFDVSIDAIRDASEDEITHGHVH